MGSSGGSGGGGSYVPLADNDWIDLGNLGATETIPGTASRRIRRKGTLDQACAITLSVPTNADADLQLVQDATGGRGVTWAGVTAWATATGTAPVTTGRAAGAIDVFSFANIGGTTIGFWLTEPMPRVQNIWRPAAALVETYFGRAAGLGNQAILTTQRMHLVGIELQAGQVITSITFSSGSTAAGTPTNQFFALVDSSLNVLAKTTDDTTTAWGTFTFKTLTLSAPYTVLTSGRYYIGVCVTATTVPNILGVTSTAAATGQAPVFSGLSASTGITTPASCPATLGALTAAGGVPWAWVT